MDLYNKYRPKRLEDLFPTSPIIQRLPVLVKRVLEGDDDAIPKAMLFYSEDYGTGKTTTARLLSVALNPGMTDDERDAIMKGNDTITCKTINGARFRGIGDMSSLDEEIQYKKDPLIGSRFVYVIDEAHKITPDAQDLLLKTIEDLCDSPVYLILTSSQYSKNNSALLSRVQKYFFRALTESELVELMKDICTKEGMSVEESVLTTIAQLSGGSARDALSRLSQYFLTRNYGPGDVDTLDEGVQEARYVIDTLLKVLDSEPDKSNVTWKMVVNVLRSGMQKTRADDFRIELLKHSVYLLEKPPRVRQRQKLPEAMRIVIEGLMTPVSYPEKTHLTAMVYLIYTQLRKLSGV